MKAIDGPVCLAWHDLPDLRDHIDACIAAGMHTLFVSGHDRGLADAALAHQIGVSGPPSLVLVTGVGQVSAGLEGMVRAVLASLPHAALVVSDVPAVTELVQSIARQVGWPDVIVAEQDRAIDVVTQLVQSATWVDA